MVVRVADSVGGDSVGGRVAVTVGVMVVEMVVETAEVD